MRYLILTFCLCCASMVVVGQRAVKCRLLDAATGQPVPFANVLFVGLPTGTMSDINGTFDIGADQHVDSVLVTCLGYESKGIGLKQLGASADVKLVPLPYRLDELKVLPGKNPALTVMENVVAQRDKNNPDVSTDYRCIVYHKMAFRYDVPDSVLYFDTKRSSLQQAMQKHDVMLIESVSEKLHLKPDKSHERLLTGRVSGFENPALAALPAQIQPFVFYNDYLALLDREYLNPVSKRGLREYSFVLEDTVADVLGDTIFYISFSPKRNANINGLSGALHVHAQTWGLRSVSASTLPANAGRRISVRQFYRRVDGQWFPEQLESSLYVRSAQGSSLLPFPLLAEGKSYVTSVDLAPDLSHRDFSSVTFSDRSARADAPSVERFRYQPLTAKDSATYRFIDSLGHRGQLDRLLSFQKNLLDGYIPVGALKLDFRKLADYSSFEGWKLGLGLWTGTKVSKTVSVGGFWVRSMGRDESMYGGGFRLNLAAERQAFVRFDWRNEYAETGVFSFLDGYKAYSPESFRKFLTETMDRSVDWRISAESRLLGGLKGRGFYGSYSVRPQIPYSFSQTTGTLAPSYHGVEAGVQLRWHPGETVSSTALGVFANSSRLPVFWGNVTWGKGTDVGPFEFMKAEAQVEQRFRLLPSHSLVLRGMAGSIWGSYPVSFLYSGFGTYKGLGLQIPHTFSTMRMNEFGANRFAIASVVYDWQLNSGSAGNFKPMLEASTMVGFADSNGASIAFGNQVRAFSKGFYESGIAVKNLLHLSIVKYGIGLNYRYGPYALQGIDNNLAAVIVVEFAL